MKKKSFWKPRKIIGGLVGPLVLLVLLPVPANAYPRPGIAERVSVASDGAEAEPNSYSYDPAVSDDGRHVAFLSDASNLVPGDTNAAQDVFVHDRATGGTTERVSVASDGTQANNYSFYPAISADGRHVAFSSGASNLVPGDTNGAWDVFAHDRGTGTTERVSVTADGAEANSSSGIAGISAISADGRHVAFLSDASNLVPGDTNGATDAFVHDRTTGATERVSVATDGAQANAYSFEIAIGGDGRHVAFSSGASNLVPGDINGAVDVFVHDRATGNTERVSVASDGAEANSYSVNPAISADGRHVAFTSYASNLVPADTNRYQDVFVHDRAAGATERVSVTSDGAEAGGDRPAISADGRYVAFKSGASSLVTEPEVMYLTVDVFVHDRATGATRRVSVASDGTEAAPSSVSVDPAISAGGRHVAFLSTAPNLVPGDTNGSGSGSNSGWDVFVHDRGGSLGVAGTPSFLKVPGGVDVSGRATFSGATLAGATDPDDDGTGMGLGAANVGAELTGAALIYRPEQEDLLLRLDLSSLPSDPAGAGLPGVLYGADLQVGETRYEVRALRAAATAQSPAVPHFALYRCDPSCTQQASLSGGIGTTGTEVVFSIPLTALGAQEGASLTQVRAFTAVGEAAPGALHPLDEVALSSSVIPASRVELGIAPASTPGDQVAFTAQADLLAGEFSGAIPTDGLSPGSYRVWARACLGDACGPAAFGEVDL